MAGKPIVQIGNGTYNGNNNTYTYYDPATGQITTKLMQMRGPGQQGTLSPTEIQNLQNGTADINQYLHQTDSNYLGGRSNVNISNQIGLLFGKLKQQYPNMTKEQISNYANEWVSERIAAGWDANNIEDWAKGALRDDKELGGDFEKGITSRIARNEYDSLGKDATGANTAVVDPRGSIQDELRAFAGRMMSVLPPDHPQVQRIAELGAQAGNKYATASGMGPGGLTARGVSGVTQRAMVDLQTQREGIGAQALAAAGNQQLNVDQLNTQLQQANQQANVMQGSNIGGMIGTGVGAIGSIVAAAYGGGAAVPGIMAAGTGGGSALGGIVANGNQPPIKYGGGGGIGGGSSYKGRDWGGGTS